MSDRAELIRALAVLAEEPRADHDHLPELLGLPPLPTAAEHTGVYVLQVYPYASVYLGEEGMMGGEARDRVSGFWRAVGQTPPPEADHIAALLGLYAGLLSQAEAETDAARRVLVEQAAAALLWEHILSWMPPFVGALRSWGTDFHRAWSDLLIAVLVEEAGRFPYAGVLPSHVRSAAELIAGDDPADHIAAVLAPVRSGIVITRGDLARGAATAGVGLRVGERRFILKAMFEQDPRATLRWMADFAAAWRDSHTGLRAGLGDLARFWEDRAARAAELFAQMKTGSEDEEAVVGV